MLPLLARLKAIPLLQLAVVCFRYLIGSAFVFASIVKIQGLRFMAVDGSGYPLDSPPHMFEVLYRSGLWWQFIGWAQLVAGGLMMTQRYAKLGALLFLPIIANIFLITVSYQFSGTWVIAGLMLLGTLGLLLWEWDSLRVLVNQPSTPIDGRHAQTRVWEWTGLALFAWTVGFRSLAVQYDLFRWAGVCTLIGLTGCAIAVWRSRRKAILTA